MWLTDSRLYLKGHTAFTKVFLSPGCVCVPFNQKLFKPHTHRALHSIALVKQCNCLRLNGTAQFTWIFRAANTPKAQPKECRQARVSFYWPLNSRNFHTTHNSSGTRTLMLGSYSIHRFMKNCDTNRFFFQVEAITRNILLSYHLHFKPPFPTKPPHHHVLKYV